MSSLCRDLSDASFVTFQSIWHRASHKIQYKTFTGGIAGLDVSLPANLKQFPTMTGRDISGYVLEKQATLTVNPKMLNVCPLWVFYLTVINSTETEATSNHQLFKFLIIKKLNWLTPPLTGDSYTCAPLWIVSRAVSRLHLHTTKCLLKNLTLQFF